MKLLAFLHPPQQDSYMHIKHVYDFGDELLVIIWKGLGFGLILPSKNMGTKCKCIITYEKTGSEGNPSRLLINTALYFHTLTDFWSKNRN